jgi:hypothetical protein
MAMSKEAQVAESEANRAAGTNPADRAAALDTGEGDGAPQEPVAAAAKPAPEPTQPREAPISWADAKRAAISARFRSERGVEDTDQDDNITDYARTGGMPQDLQDAAAPAAEPEPAEDAEISAEISADIAAEPAPQTVRLKVHGKEIDMSLADVVAKAQIALATDNILDEAKSRLKEIDALAEQARTRAAAPAANTTQQSPAQPANPELAPGDPQHQGDVKTLSETLQYGDPAEAEAMLRNTIDQAAGKIVQQQLYNERIKDEGARAARVLEDFAAANADLAADPMANAAIQSKLFELQVEDLKQIGVDPSRIRQDGQPPTPGDIALAHRHFRATGMKVRSPEQMLETAKENFLTWKGVKKEPVADPANKGAPRIDVTVDRSARRQAIPQQPSRANTPRQTATTQAAQPRDRSAIVADMKATRARTRGVVLGN